MENKKPFIGINVGKKQIDMSEFPICWQALPTRIYLKEDGTVDNQPSFGILFESPVTAPVLGQVSLKMLNEGLADVGYKVVKI